VLLIPGTLLALRIVDDTDAAALVSPTVVVTILLFLLIVGVAVRTSAARSLPRAITGGAATLIVAALFVLPMVQVIGRRPCPERLGPDRGLQVGTLVFDAWRNRQAPPASVWQSASVSRAWSARVEKLVLLDYRLMESGCWERLAPVPTRTTWHEFRVTVQRRDGDRFSKVITVHTRATRGEWHIADIEGPEP
jgi:hypothetical protein